MWTKEDSNNLTRLTIAIEKIASIETVEIRQDFWGKLRKKFQTDESVKVTDTRNDLEERYDFEQVKAQESIASKLAQAERENSMPFFPEDLMDAEELEQL